MSVQNFDELKHHVAHRLECVSYGEPGNPVNVAVECMDCHTVIMDFDAEDEETGGEQI